MKCLRAKRSTASKPYFSRGKRMGSRMTIGTKLMGSSVAMLLVTLALGLSSLNSISRLSDSFEESVNKTAKKIVLSDAITIAGSDMLAGQRGVIESTFGKLPAAAEKGK